MLTTPHEGIGMVGLLCDEKSATMISIQNL